MDHERCRALLSGADHGVLATVRPDGRPHLVPVCFVTAGAELAVPIDDVKAKTSTNLQRQRNLRAHPAASLLVEQWDPDDWSNLWWVRADMEPQPATGHDDHLEEALREALRDKYAQYRDASFAALLRFSVTNLTGWHA